MQPSKRAIGAFIGNMGLKRSLKGCGRDICWKWAQIRCESTQIPQSQSLSRKELFEGKNKDTHRNDTGDPDPFALQDMDEETSKRLVQGYLHQSEKHPLSISEDIDKDYSKATSENLSKYEAWLQERQLINKGLSQHDSDRFRTGSFGSIRLDSDNLPTSDDPHDIEEEVFIRRYHQHPQPTKKSYEDEDDLPITPYEYLKKVKEKTKRAETKKGGDDATITSTVKSRKSKQQSQEEIYGPRLLEMSLKVEKDAIPKAYQLPRFERLSRDDIWNMLRQSVVFQNDFLIALNKIAGIPVQSSSYDCSHFYLQFLDKIADIGKCDQVFPIHRLDKETTGVLLFAKNEKAAAFIKQMFKSRLVNKVYLAIVKHCPQVQQGTINIPVGEGQIQGTKKFRSVLRPDLREYNVKAPSKDAKQAITKFQVIKSTKDASFLQLEPITGVKHQLRVHLGLGLGCPVLGDHKYSHRDRLAPQRLPSAIVHALKIKQSKVRHLPLHLHCSTISFDYPQSDPDEPKEPIHIHAKAPHFFSHTLRALHLK